MKNLAFKLLFRGDEIHEKPRRRYFFRVVNPLRCGKKVLGIRLYWMGHTSLVSNWSARTRSTFTQKHTRPHNRWRIENERGEITDEEEEEEEEEEEFT